MNKIFAKLLLSVMVLIIIPVFAGGQGSRRIYDSIEITNDTDSNVLINQDRILKPKEVFEIAQETLDKQTQKIINIYVINKKQPHTWSYFTYGKAEGSIAERFDAIRLKISELLKEKNKKQGLVGTIRSRLLFLGN